MSEAGPFTSAMMLPSRKCSMELRNCRVRRAQRLKLGQQLGDKMAMIHNMVRGISEDNFSLILVFQIGLGVCQLSVTCRRLRGSSEQLGESSETGHTRRRRCGSAHWPKPHPSENVCPLFFLRVRGQRLPLVLYQLFVCTKNSPDPHLGGLKAQGGSEGQSYISRRPEALRGLEHRVTVQPQVMSRQV